jgi:hypothetical protein
MEQRSLKKVNNYWNIKNSVLLETPAGKNLSTYFTALHFINTA